MKKYTKVVSGIAALLLVLAPMMPVSAQEPTTDDNRPVVEVENKKTVKTVQELLDALNDDTISTIILGDNIETTQKINILRDVTIDGNHKSLTYTGTFGKEASSSNTVWGGIYVLQVYTSKVTIKDIKLTGGNGGLMVNGGDATLIGDIDVSGNGFGGIEVSMGSNVTTAPSLVFENATLINDSESDAVPSIWTDGIKEEYQDEVKISYNGVEAAVSVDKEGKVQTQLFLSKENVPTGDNVTILDENDFKGEPVVEPTPTPTPEPTPDPDEEENPSTSDHGLLYVALGAIGLGGFALTLKNFRKQER